MEIIYTDSEPNSLIILATVLGCAGIALIIGAISALAEEEFGFGIFVFICGVGFSVGSALLFMYCINHPSMFIVARFNEEIDINKLFETYENIQPYKDGLFKLLLK